MSCFQCDGIGYRRMCNYNPGDHCNHPPGICPQGKVLRFCPGSNKPMCVHEGTMWMDQCPRQPTGLCPQGQSLHFCPNGKKVCAYPGTDLRQKCGGSPY